MKADTDSNESAYISFMKSGETEIIATETIVGSQIVIVFRRSSKFTVCIQDGAEDTNHGENEEIRDR